MLTRWYFDQTITGNQCQCHSSTGALTHSITSCCTSWNDTWNDTNVHIHMYFLVAASWSSGRVQDSGLGSRSSPWFNTLPMRLLVVPLSKALHAILLLATQEEMGTCDSRFVSRGAKLCVSGCIIEMDIQTDMDSKGWMWTQNIDFTWMWTRNSDFTFIS